MLFLIDGYNLLHAMGVLHARVGPTGLQKARLHLLGLLHGVLGPDSAKVTVVFDAAHAPPGAVGEQEHQGIHVRFAIHEDQADDLIEDLIQHSSAPRQVTLVSDDHRLQKAGRRRKCTVMGCLDFLDWLDRQRRQQTKPSKKTMKPGDVPSVEESRFWAQEFADLENDPDFKEVFNYPDFEEPKG